MARFASALTKFFAFGKMDPLLEQTMLMNQLSAPMLMVQFREQERQIQELERRMSEEAEQAIREEHEETEEVVSTSTEKAAERTEVSHFALLYYNPVLKRTEVVVEDVTLKLSEFKSPEQQVIEESVAQKSTLSIYSRVAAPLMYTKIDPYILDSVLKSIEVEQPKPFGGAAAVMLPKREITAKLDEIEKGGTPEEIVAVDAIREMEERKANISKEIGKETIALETAIQALQETDKPADKLLEKLPPLSKARYLALLRKRKDIERILLIDLLILDAEFLENFKKKLKSMSIRELVKNIRKLKGIMKKQK